MPDIDQTITLYYCLYQRGQKMRQSRKFLIIASLSLTLMLFLLAIVLLCGFLLIELRSAGILNGDNSPPTSPQDTALTYDFRKSLFDESTFTHAAYLDANNTVLFKWSVKTMKPSTKPDVLVAELTAPTRGWLSFGVSPNGGMIGANMLVMWVDSDTGHAHVQDRYATAFAEPLVNDDQTTTVLAFEGHENATHTVMKFARWLDAGCRIEHGITIGSSAVRIIYAFHVQDDIAADGHMIYHGALNRGSKTLYLLDDEIGTAERDQQAALADSTSTFEFVTQDLEVPTIDTYYHCEFFQLPNFTTNTHIVGFEPILPSPLQQNLVHHIVVHLCDVNIRASPLRKTFPCYDVGLDDASMFGSTDFTSCMDTFLWTWAVGGGAQYFPHDVGYLLTAERDAGRYAVVETHFNNPNLEARIRETTGVRLLLSALAQRRLKHASQLLVAAEPNEHIIVPGHMPRFTVPALCHSTCTEKHFPTQGVKIFAGFLHSHLTGKSLVLRHFRSQKELPVIASDPTYDFNYQTWRALNTTVLPGDELVLECTYSTAGQQSRNVTTVGGYSTKDEMCIAFLFVTPAIQLNRCISFVDRKRTFNVLNITDISHIEPKRNRTAASLYEKKVRARLTSIMWKADEDHQDEVARKIALQKVFTDTEHTYVCLAENSKLFGKRKVMEAGWSNYQPPPTCKANGLP